MRASTTPLRITLGGGGSDLAPNGICVTAAVNLYTHVIANTNRSDLYTLKYSELEIEENIGDIKHQLFREILDYCNVPPGIEIATISDVSSGSGLGTSAAFTVGLLRVLQLGLTKWELARLATTLDIGLQDQYATTFGGIRVWSFTEIVTEEEIRTPEWLQLSLYDTGLRRDAYETLQANPRPDQQTLREQAQEMVDILRNGGPTAFGRALTKQWTSKWKAAPTAAHRAIDDEISELLGAGALGAKLIGAGDGGMILAQGPRLPGAIPIEIDYRGTRLL